MTTIIGERDPQSIFWKKSAAEVPPEFEKALLAAFGRDECGDPNVRVRLDDEKFSEPIWVVEEKWQPSVFGSALDWNATKSITDEHGTVEFGDFPSKGIYASVMLWTDYEGHSLPLSEKLIEKLKMQRQLREQKDISPEKVMLETLESEKRVEALQAQRVKDAEREIAENVKMKAEKILAASTRVMGLPAGTPKHEPVTIH